MYCMACIRDQVKRWPTLLKWWMYVAARPKEGLKIKWEGPPSYVVSIFCPPDWGRVNWSAQNWGTSAYWPPAPTALLIWGKIMHVFVVTHRCLKLGLTKRVSISLKRISHTCAWFELMEEFRGFSLLFFVKFIILGFMHFGHFSCPRK